MDTSDGNSSAPPREEDSALDTSNNAQHYDPRSEAFREGLFLPKECYRFFEYKVHKEQRKLGYNNNIQFGFTRESLLSLGSVIRSYIRAKVEGRLGVAKRSDSSSKRLKSMFLNSRFKSRRFIRKIQRGLTMREGRLNPVLLVAEQRLCAQCKDRPVKIPCLCDHGRSIAGFDHFMERLLFCSEECHAEFHKSGKSVTEYIEKEDIVEQDGKMVRPFYLVKHTENRNSSKIDEGTHEPSSDSNSSSDSSSGDSNSGSNSSNSSSDIDSSFKDGDDDDDDDDNDNNRSSSGDDDEGNNDGCDSEDMKFFMPLPKRPSTGNAFHP